MNRISVVAAALFFLSFMPTLHAGEEGISVTASGSVQVRPDIAVFDVTVQSVERDAARAAARTAGTWAVLQKALREAGIPVEDSPSAGYTVRPQWVWDQSAGKNVLKGYLARHVVRVSVRDLRLAGRAVDAAVQAGAGEVGEVRFSSSRLESLRKEALDLAVRKAREDAGVMAKAAGGRLGAVIEMTADPQQGPQVPMMDAMMMKSAAPAPSTEISPGEEQVSVTVHSRWRFIGATAK
jgi:hypothetical protein